MAKPFLSPLQAAKRLKLYRKGTVAAFEAFCNDCAFITGGDDESGDTSAIPFKWWPSQRELATALCDPEIREIIILKSRQIGMTWVILAWKLWRVMFWHGIEERITSVGQDESAKALLRVRFMIDHLPEWLGFPAPEICNTTTIKIGVTGSWITALPATINAGKGDTLNDFLADEAAFQVYAKQIVNSARPALEKRHGKLIVNSTANGVSNWFAEQYLQAEKGKNGYKHFFFGWKADPTRTQAWYDRTLAKHGPEYTHLNYPRTAIEALTASGAVTFFNQERVASDLGRDDEPFHDGFLDLGAGGMRGIMPAFHHDANGSLRLWRAPEENHTYVMFVDPSLGKDTSDPTNGYVYDVGERAIVARIRGKLDVVDTADLAMAVSAWYGSGPKDDRAECLTAIERNSMGVAVVNRMLDAGHRNVWQDINWATKKVKEGVFGWYTSGGVGGGGSRGMMLGKLQAEYRMGRVNVRDKDCLEEMAVFSYINNKAQAPAGKNDDCVMCLAGCVTIALFVSVAEEQDDETAGLYGARLAAMKAVEAMKAGVSEGPHPGIVELGG